MRLMNTDVVGSLPAVKDWRRRLSPIQLSAPWMVHTANGNGHSNGAHRMPPSALIPAAKTQDQALTNYEEAIRTLRNSILLTGISTGACGAC